MLFVLFLCAVTCQSNGVSSNTLHFFLVWNWSFLYVNNVQLKADPFCEQIAICWMQRWRGVFQKDLWSFSPRRFLCSGPILVVSPCRYLVRRKGGRASNQAFLSMLLHEALPHQTKWVCPRCASLGIFNTAGYEVLIALLLTSQIPLSVSLLPLLYSFHSSSTLLSAIKVSVSMARLHYPSAFSKRELPKRLISLFFYNSLLCFT